VTSPRIIVDGYNLIHAIPELARMLTADAESARDRLVLLLADCAARRNAEVMIVFDGRRGQAGLPSRGAHRVQVVFSRSPQTADDVIKGLLVRSGHPRATTVVTSDNSIALHCRDYGARVVKSGEFADQLTAGHKSRTSGRKPTDRPLSAAEVAEWEAFFRTRRPGSAASGRGRPKSGTA
jgi:predicted RNA-binding protein with PIN domain